MALTKISRSLLDTGVSDSSDATAITITSDEEVGIGTTTPNSYAFNDPTKLVVANTSGHSTISIVSGTSSNGYLAFADGTSGTARYSGSIQYNHSSNYMSFQTSDGTERVRIDSSGNVGIGNTSPRQKFNVTGPLVSTGALASLGAAGSYTDGAFDATALDYYNDGARSWCWGGSSTRGTFNWYQLENDGQNQINSMQLDASGNLLFNSGFGSAGTAYGVRAWVNFNGSGTVAIRGSGNVSSITDNGVGSYTINFTNAMPDTNYLTSGIGGLSSANLIAVSQPINNSGSIATGSVLVHVVYQNGTGFDAPYVGVKIIR